MMLGPAIIGISRNYWSDQGVFARQGEGTLTNHAVSGPCISKRGSAVVAARRQFRDGHDRPRRKQPPEFVIDPDWRWVPSADFAR